MSSDQPIKRVQTPHVWLIRLIGVIVPKRLRADWRQEWEAELRYREQLLAEWHRLNWQSRFDLLRRSLGAFWDALLLQPSRWEDEMFQDLRFGVRMLLKSPSFTVMAVLSLALGIGANAAVFSLLDAVLLKALPVPQPERLVFLERSGGSEIKRSSNISYSTFGHLRDQNQVLAGLCAFSYTTRVNVGIDEQVEVIEGQMVSGSFFSVLGVGAVAGRTFTEEDDRGAGEAAVAMISDRYWQNRFSRNPDVVGRTVILNRTPITIIGVTPTDFFGVIIGNAPDIYYPISIGEQILPRRFRLRDSTMTFVLARLKPDVTESQAGAALTLLSQQAALDEVGSQLSAEQQQAIQGQTIKLLPASQGVSALRQQYAEPLQLLMAVAGLVLLIACANVANLLLARSAARRKEVAVRLALGASRLRLIRQLLLESLLLAGLGGGFGLVLAFWCNGLLLDVVASGRNPVTSGSRLSLQVPLDGRVIGFAILVSLLAAVLFGLAPAWRATRLDLSPTLKENARALAGGAHFRWGRMLVVTQVAMSLALLVGAGLFARSLGNLQRQDIGFKRENVLLFSVDPQLLRYSGPQIASLYKKMFERLEAVPGVQAVSLSRQGLLNGSGTQGSIRVPGREPNAEENSVIQTNRGAVFNVPDLSQVGPRFFETVGMTILRGRDFDANDHETARKVAVVNEAFARYYFGDEDPIGQRFDRGSDNGGEVEIVGLVRDAKLVDIEESTRRAFYVPFLQDPSSWRETTFQVRSVADPENLVGAIRSAVQQVDTNLPIFRVRTLQEQVDESLGQQRLVSTLASLFGLLALLLACAGLYGVLSYSVSQRTHEIGIRLALGARPVRVLWMVMRESLALVMTGIILGTVASLAAGRWIASLLFGLTAADPSTLLMAILVMISVAAVAAWMPARRAARVEPMLALRHE